VAIEYRLARPDDAAPIARLHARSWREHYRGTYPDSFLDGDLAGERLQVWRARLDRPAENQRVELAVDGAELLGFVCAYADCDAAWGSLIDNLHVARAAQQRGIGARLLKRAGLWLQVRCAARPVHLLVLESNAPARHFYERLGAANHGAAQRESPGGLVWSCLYAWPTPELLSGVAEARR
jgi:ribosomal protein S18 acetylase RimI-like enzyme